MPQRIVVIGAGPVGLSSAVCIQEQLPGVKVTVIAEHFSPDSTGDCAAGLLIPHAIGHTPEHLTQQWVRSSLKRSLEILNSPEIGEAGVQIISGYDVHTSKKEVPGWGGDVLNMREGTKQEKEAFGNKYQTVHAFTSIISYCPKYLPWLLQRFYKNGGEALQKRIRSFEELKAPWVKTFCILNSSESYIFPVPDGTVVVGGTHQVGNWNTNIDIRDRENILKGAYQLMPHLKNAPIVGEWVGLRPGRSEIRLELEDVELNGRKLKVVHNYGHGGSGVGLAWGCAEYTVDLVRKGLGQVSRL